ncbi:hypothetical protein BC936DRAFT_144902 [Jimgerdemannia flammicorona]|uniref:AAA-ATPase-like domain-containing protein n=1 Tax=Jimgerdemannia flammicorona TaxID=994334 RepID=A0A433DLZ8_9FUNG|nr:hypothetical protein BC936DRAFT_144902 [Jimgerdemannia flammicorona]
MVDRISSTRIDLRANILNTPTFEKGLSGETGSIGMFALTELSESPKPLIPHNGSEDWEVRRTKLGLEIMHSGNANFSTRTARKGLMSRFRARLSNQLCWVYATSLPFIAVTLRVRTSTEAEDEHLSKKARLRANEEVLAGFKNQFDNAALLPGNKVTIGHSDFQDMVNGKYSLVDKSMLIAEFVSSCDKVTLALRPRRFGKSTNLSMLRLFFERITDDDQRQLRRKLFDQTMIKDRQDLFTNEFSKYPNVGSLDGHSVRGGLDIDSMIDLAPLKDINGSTWDEMLIKVRDLIGEIYREHRYLAPFLEQNAKTEFDLIASKDPTYQSLDTALQKLSRYLDSYHKSKCVVLIDEYDAPIHEAYNTNNGSYYETALKFFQTLFSSLLKPLLFHASSKFKKAVWELLDNKPIQALIRDDIRYESLANFNDDTLWTLLYYTGYLTPDVRGLTTPHYTIPNYEVYMQWVEWVMPALSESTTCKTLLHTLVSGNINDFKEMFERTVMESLSYYDVGGESSGKHAECFYHAFVLGMFIHVQNYNYKVRSNRERGMGRYDICLEPVATHLPLAILIEFKVTNETETIESAAQKGLDQIEKKRYNVGLPVHVKQLVELGIGFKGKQVCVMGKKLTLKQRKFVGGRVC